MTQKQMFYAAHKRMMDTIDGFLEMQRSGNPMTLGELKVLIARRPDHYGALKLFLANPSAFSEE